MTAINHKEKKKKQSEKKQSYQGSYSTLNYLPQVSLAEPFLLLPWELLSWSACARPLWAPQGDTVTLLCEDRDCQSLPPHPQGEPGAAEGGGCPYLQFESALCWGQQRWSCSSPQNNLVLKGHSPQENKPAPPFPGVEKAQFSYCSIGEAPEVIGAFPASHTEMSLGGSSTVPAQSWCFPFSD